MTSLDDLTGTAIDQRYALEERLDIRGETDCYRGVQMGLGRRVTVWVHRGDSIDQAAFKRDARALSLLSHPGIAGVLEYGWHEGRPFAVTEAPEGRTLEQLAEDDSLSLERALSIFAEALEALDFAHRAGIAHGDLEPASITVAPSGKVRIFDLGIASMFGGAAESPVAARRADLVALGWVARRVLPAPIPAPIEAFLARLEGEERLGSASKVADALRIAAHETERPAAPRRTSEPAASPEPRRPTLAPPPLASAPPRAAISIPPPAAALSVPPVSGPASIPPVARAATSVPPPAAALSIPPVAAPEIPSTLRPALSIPPLAAPSIPPSAALTPLPTLSTPPMAISEIVAPRALTSIPPPAGAPTMPAAARASIPVLASMAPAAWWVAPSIPPAAPSIPPAASQPSLRAALGPVDAAVDLEALPSPFAFAPERPTLAPPAWEADATPAIAATTPPPAPAALDAVAGSPILAAAAAALSAEPSAPSRTELPRFPSLPPGSLAILASAEAPAEPEPVAPVLPTSILADVAPVNRRVSLAPTSIPAQNIQRAVLEEDEPRLTLPPSDEDGDIALGERFTPGYVAGAQRFFDSLRAEAEQVIARVKGARRPRFEDPEDAKEALATAAPLAEPIFADGGVPSRSEARFFSGADGEAQDDEDMVLVPAHVRWLRKTVGDRRLAEIERFVKAKRVPIALGVASVLFLLIALAGRSPSPGVVHAEPVPAAIVAPVPMPATTSAVIEAAPAASRPAAHVPKARHDKGKRSRRTSRR